jgi:1-acyl-sn-glycerol-3-phosphate acyltransferase
MGLIGAALGALVVGFPLVLMSPLQFLARPVRWLQALHRHRATLTAAPNFAYELCLTKIDDTELAGLDLSSVRLMFNGAEAVSAATLEQFGARFAPYGLRSSALTPVYGLAESALGVAFPPLGRGPRIELVQRAEFLTTGNAVRAGNDATSPLRFVSCGQPLPRHDLRILDDQGIALSERHQGHIQFRGPSATAGYFESPHESAALIDGAWRNTGDLGFIAAGELFVTGRSKDIIVRGGHNIHPQELEEAVGQLDGVRKGCVVAFAAAAAGTEKLVVLAETRAADPESRRALTRKINHLTVDLLGLPADEIVLAPPHTVLKTSSGKLRRAACREAFERGDLLALHRAEQSPARLALAWLRGWSRDVLRQTRETSWSVRLVLVALATAPIAVVALALARSEHARRRHIARIARTALRAAGLAPQINGDLSQLARGTTVAVVNHSSYLDSIVLTASLPPEMVFVAKNELRTARFLGPLLRRLGTVFVERFDVGAALAGAESLQRKLQQGRSLIVFPEGTFRRESGLLPFHLGAFAAAAAAGAIVVPIALAGTRRVLPDGARWPRRGAIAVNVTRPIQPTGADWRSAIALRDVARGAISAELAEGDR